MLATPPPAARARASTRAARMAPIRVMCLHSFCMSGGSLRKQMCEYSNFAASLGEQCEFRFLDGPRRCPPEKEAQMPARLKALLPPPYFGWWNARESDDGVVTYDGEEATLAHVTDFMRREGVTPHLLASPHLPLLACSPLLRLLRAPSAPLCRRTSLRRRTPPCQARSTACSASARAAAWRTCCAWCRPTTRHASTLRAPSRSEPQLAASAAWDARLRAGLLCVLRRRARTRSAGRTAAMQVERWHEAALPRVRRTDVVTRSG